jgi:hypothetical protein
LIAVWLVPKRHVHCIHFVHHGHHRLFSFTLVLFSPIPHPIPTVEKDTPPMKIGFIDHHLNNYHANKFHSLLTAPEHKDVQIVAAFESNPEGEDWCAAKSVPRAKSPAEVIAQSDAIIVLAPDNVGDHLELASDALKSGKPVMVDKTLSNQLADAKAIVELSKKHNAPLMSTSSLRFSVELEELLAAVGESKLDGIFSRGFGKLRGYGIHSIAPALRVLNGRIKRVINTGGGKGNFITLEAEDGRLVHLDIRESENQYEATPWQVGAKSGEKYHVATITKFDDFYANLMHRTVTFFRSGKSPISNEEMLDAVAVEIAAEESARKGGEWISVSIA